MSWGIWIGSSISIELRDPRFEFNIHGGVNFFWDDFMLSPQAEIAYNSGKSEIVSPNYQSGLSIGAGLIANYRIVGPLGVWGKICWMSPIGFEPVSFGPGGTTSFAVGLTMFWFRWQIPFFESFVNFT